MNYLKSERDQRVNESYKKERHVASYSAPRHTDSASLQIEQEWLMSLLDPFNHIGRQPSYCPLPTAVFQVKMPVVVTTDANGRFFFCMRDSLRRAKSNSFTDITGGGAYGWVYGSAGWYMPGGAPPTNPSNGAASTNWFPVDEYQAIQDLYQAFRVTGMGVELKYIAPPTTAQGEICGSLWTTAEDYPTSNTVNVAKTFNQLKEERYAHVEPAINGIRVTGLPGGVDVTKFRQSYYKGYSSYNAAAVLSFDEVSDSWLHQAQTFAGFALGGAMYGSTTTGSTFTGIDMGTSVASPFSSFYTQLSNDHCHPYTFFCPFVAGEGLVPNTQVYSGYAVINCEAIIDEQTFVAGIGRATGQMQPAYSNANKVMSVVHQVPPAGPASGNVGSKVVGYLKKAASATQKIAKGGKTKNLVSKLTEAGADAVTTDDVFDTIAEVASAALAFL